MLDGLYSGHGNGTTNGQIFYINKTDNLVMTLLGNEYYTNPVPQTRLPPTTGWLLYDGLARPDVLVNFYQNNVPENIRLLSTESTKSKLYQLEDKEYNGWPTYISQFAVDKDQESFLNIWRFESFNRFIDLWVV